MQNKGITLRSYNTAFTSSRRFSRLAVIAFKLSGMLHESDCLLKLMYSYYKIWLFAILRGCGRCDGCET